MKRRSRPRSRTIVRAVQRLRLQPGEVLVLTHPADATAQMRNGLHRMVHHLRDMLGQPNLPVVILPDGYSFSTLNPQGAPDAQEAV